MAETSRLAGIHNAESGAYLGPGSKVNGKLLFEGNATIEGEIDGELLVHGNLTVGEHAVIKGKVSATSALIRGKVNADIQTDKKIEIQPPGVVVGDVVTQSLIIGDGALLDGHCSMRKEKEGKILPLLRQEGAGKRTDELSS
jgi:cytoskeletal protein CcmA (bactofilin family)